MIVAPSSPGIRYSFLIAIERALRRAQEAADSPSAATVRAKSRRWPGPQACAAASHPSLKPAANHAPPLQSHEQERKLLHHRGDRADCASVDPPRVGGH